MAGSSLMRTIVTAVLTGFCFISWIILLAGNGAFQAWAASNGADDVGEAVSYYWWVIWFALPLLVGAVAAIVKKHPPFLVRPLALLFAVEFAKLTAIVDSEFKAKTALDNEYYSIPGELENSVNATLAGGIMLAMGVLAMTVWLAVVDALVAPQAAQASGQAAAAPAPGHVGAPVNTAGYPANAPKEAAGGYSYGAGTPQVGNYSPPQPVPVAGAPGTPDIHAAAQWHQHQAAPTPGAPLPGAPIPGAPPPGAPPSVPPQQA